MLAVKWAVVAVAWVVLMAVLLVLWPFDLLERHRRPKKRMITAMLLDD